MNSNDRREIEKAKSFLASLQGLSKREIALNREDWLLDVLQKSPSLINHAEELLDGVHGWGARILARDFLSRRFDSRAVTDFAALVAGFGYSLSGSDAFPSPYDKVILGGEPLSNREKAEINRSLTWLFTQMGTRTRLN